MKYGYTDKAWDEISGKAAGPICGAITLFNQDGFQAFMKRKTVRADELQMLACLTEMVEMMNDHVKEMKVKK